MAEWKGVYDSYGLTLPNNYLNLFIPATNSCIVLWVKWRHNPNFTLSNYGPLPTTTSTGFSLYASGVGGSSGTGSATAAAAGQIPASAWVKGLQFNVPSTFFVQGTFPQGNSDIWYTQNKNRVFEVWQDFDPDWLRCQVDIPSGQLQETWQDSVVGGVDQDFGWIRGVQFTVHIPNIHYGYGYGNDTNMPVFTRVFFRYAEQEVELVRDPVICYQVISNMIPNNTVPLPVVSNQQAIEQAMNITYGFTGLPVFPRNRQEDAINRYTQLLNQPSVTSIWGITG